MTTTTTTTTLKNCSFFDCGPQRLRSRSVSWNRSGHYLAIASSCAAIRLYAVAADGSTTTTTTTPTNNNNTSSKEIGSLTGHGGPVTMVRFHWNDDSILASAATDGTVRLWDVRDHHGQRSSSSSSTSASTAKLTEQAGLLAMEWNPVQSDLFLIAKRTGEIEIYDRRKLTTTTTTSSSGAAAAAAATPVYHHFAKDENGPRVPDAAVFEPTKGDTVYYGSTSAPGEGTADIRTWKFGDNNNNNRNTTNHGVVEQEPPAPPCNTSYLAHVGPIYTMAFGPDGRNLVTGGADAIVGIWNVAGPTTAASMCCTRTIANRTNKYIRSVAISSDGQCLAIATEEGAIDLVQLEDHHDDHDDDDTVAAAAATTVKEIGQVPLGDKTSGCTGAEAIAFHPTAKYTLACARVGDNSSSSRSPVTIVRFETQQ